MSDFKDQWNIEMARRVLEDPDVDAVIWSEAVKWMLLYGPPEMREILLQASGHAVKEHFPDLSPAGFTENGELCYDTKTLAKALGLSEKETTEKIAALEAEQDIQFFVDPSEAKKIQ